MEDKLKEQVEKLVAGILASKDEETMRKTTQEALQASADKIEALTTEVASKEASIVEKEAELAKFVSEVTSLKEETASTLSAKDEELKSKDTEIASLTEAKTTLEAELETVNVAFATLKKEIAADKRMAELADAGVLREDASVQRAKILDMTDEAFTSYKEELVSIKSQVIASLKPTGEEAPVVPAKVDPQQSAQAALNLESTPSKTLTEKYQELGKAMAEAISKKK